MTDTNTLVNGKVIEILKNAGIDVICGIIEKEYKKVFIKYVTQKTPFVVMKTAMTLDGKIATATGDSKWVSCEESRRNSTATITAMLFPYLFIESLEY